MTWEGLTPPYSTIVADPPWDHSDGFPINAWRRNGDTRSRKQMPYSAMTLDAIRSLPVDALAADDAHLYLWTTNRFLREAFSVAEAWGFSPRQTLVWCKQPIGVGPGGAFSVTAEFVLFARRGQLKATERVGTSWWEWKRGTHSAKPAAFMDIVERVSPGPYVELFARAPRLGWDSWGKGYEVVA